jgi:hypothetical protein
MLIPVIYIGSDSIPWRRDLKNKNTPKLTLEDRVQRLEIASLYRSVTRRLLEVYEEQRREEKLAQEGIEPADGSNTPRVLHVKDLASIVQKSAKWLYQHAPQLGGKKFGGAWVFTKEGLESALLGQGSATVAGDSPIQKTKMEKSVQDQKGRHGVGSSVTKRPARTGHQQGDEDRNRHGLADLL